MPKQYCTEEAFVSRIRPPMVGVLTHPVPGSGPARQILVLYLNAGRLYHVGPHRLYVKLARELASRGFASCRFDLRGIGDSVGDRLSTSRAPTPVQDVMEVMDELFARGSYSKCLLVGICSGADVALEVCCRDSRVHGAVLINGSLVSAGLYARVYRRACGRAALRAYLGRLFRADAWKRLLSGKSAVRHWIRIVTRGAASGFRQPEAARGPDAAGDIQSWSHLAKRNVPLLVLYSEGSMYWDIFQCATRKVWAQCVPPLRIACKTVPGADHTFTALSSQEHVVATVAQWASTAMSATTWGSEDVDGRQWGTGIH